MDFEIKGQYFLSLTVGGESDFLETEDDLISFVTHEEAGNVLPTFMCCFTITQPNEKLIKNLNEGNRVDVKIGKDRDKAVQSYYVIETVELNRTGEHQWTITLTGVLDCLPYLVDSKILSYGPYSGVQCILEVAQGHFSCDSNITSSQDEQVWIQPNIPDRKFVSNVWLHSYRSGSFVCLGIAADKTFILKDIKKESGEKWKFGHKEGDDWIKYSSDYVLRARSGLINHWMGFGRSRTVLDLDEDTYVDDSGEEFEPFLSNTDVFQRNKNVTSRALDFRIINANVHANYWNAYKRNITSLALFSNINLTLEYEACFEPMKVLDRVFFVDTEAKPKGMDIVYQSGNYYLTAITRRIDYKNCSTTVKLNREALSEIRGELR